VGARGRRDERYLVAFALGLLVGIVLGFGLFWLYLVWD
jgi:hypothetical protein